MVVKTLNGSEHDGRDLLNDDMDFMLSQVAENISFFFFIEIENFRRERTVFHFYFFKENGKSEAVFQHF